jgi:nucleotide-binding universal stress UspA family protein
MTLKHILVPTDFSEASDRAVAMALELARAFDARVTLLHVWSIPTLGYAEALTWPIDEMEQAAKKALDGALASTSKLYAKTEALLRQGIEWKQIVETAKERGCDLVVMGTHGRRGLPRLVLGSVAEKVVRLSPVPVVTVGSPERGRER